MRTLKLTAIAALAIPLVLVLLLPAIAAVALGVWALVTFGWIAIPGAIIAGAIVWRGVYGRSDARIG